MRSTPSLTKVSATVTDKWPMCTAGVTVPTRLWSWSAGKRTDAYSHHGKRVAAPRRGKGGQNGQPREWASSIGHINEEHGSWPPHRSAQTRIADAAAATVVAAAMGTCTDAYGLCCAAGFEADGCDACRCCCGAAAGRQREGETPTRGTGRFVGGRCRKPAEGKWTCRMLGFETLDGNLEMVFFLG